MPARFWNALRLAVCGLVLGAVAGLAGDAWAKESVILTDVAGREVRVQIPVDKMILGEGRFLPTLAILERADPTKRVGAMMGEFERFDPATFAQYAKAFPAIRKIPILGTTGAASFSTEHAIVGRPDVAVFGLGSGHGPSTRHKDILDRLKAAGIPVVVIDFRMDPLVNTPKSIELLGRLMGREEQAREFLSFYQAQLDKVKSGLAGITRKPSVFMELRVGLGDQCCDASGNSMLGRFISWAGGVNAFGDKIPGTHGRVNVEHLITDQPDVYIGTAIGSAMTETKYPKFISLGVGTSGEAARASLARSLQRVGPAQLAAVKAGRAYTIWHHFYNTPMHVAAVQVMAKWFHPDRFKALDPRATLAEYFRRFQPVPMAGVYWAGLSDP